jgi:hypothetical protein
VPGLPYTLHYDCTILTKSLDVETFRKHRARVMNLEFHSA